MNQMVTSLIASYNNDWRIRLVIVLPLMIIWLSILSSADSFFSPYILYALICMVSCMRDSVHLPCASKREIKYSVLFSTFFSTAIIFANYGILLPIRGNIFSIILLFFVGYIIGWYTLKLFLIEGYIQIIRRKRNKKTTRRWFLLPFASISLIYLLVLFFCYKPGFLTMDSVSQIHQNLTGLYSNHHPYWHTMLIKVFMDLGMALFSDINMAVLVYHVFQTLCMSAIFSFIIWTMYEAGIPKVWIIISLVSYAILPYHFMYSMTMWKDVLFGGAVALFVCTLYRMMNNMESKKVNYFTLAISTLGCCLLRSNGMAAFIFTFLVLLFLLKRKEAKMLLVLFAVIIVSFIMKRPVLQVLDVPQPSFVESLSIPVQQIARIIVDGEHIEDNNLAKIEQIMDIQSAKEEYKPYISDPIKKVVGENLNYINEHRLGFLSLWLQLGIKHPGSYFRAWIDQTRGYWNAGYDYWIVTYGVTENEYGIRMDRPENLVAKLVRPWVVKFFFHPAFEVFRSIGLHVWVIILCFIVQLIRRCKETLLFVLPLALFLTLLVSTPVFSEFRYIYAVFASFPFLVLTTIFNKKELSKESGDNSE